jgi:hypothetical protein
MYWSREKGVAMGAMRRSAALVLIAALTWVPGLTATAAPNNAPVGKIRAQSSGLVTTFTAAMTDPDNHSMFYKWHSKVGCGKFTPGDAETATWDRGAGTPCTPGADADGLVWVHVTDIVAHVGCFYRGSASGEGGDCVSGTDVSRRTRLILRDKAGKLVVSGNMKLTTSLEGADLSGCIANQELFLVKKKGTKWVDQKKFATNEKGVFSTEVAPKPGSYRVESEQLFLGQPSGDHVVFYNCLYSSSPPIPNR